MGRLDDTGHGWAIAVASLLLLRLAGGFAFWTWILWGTELGMVRLVVLGILAVIGVVAGLGTAVNRLTGTDS